MPTVSALRDLCRSNNIRGYSSANKTTLLQLLADAGIEVEEDTPSSKKSSSSSKSAPISPQPYVVRSFFASLTYVRVTEDNAPAYLKTSLSNKDVVIYAIYDKDDNVPQEYRIVEKSNDKYAAVAVNDRADAIPEVAPVRKSTRISSRASSTPASPTEEEFSATSRYTLRAETSSDAIFFITFAGETIRDVSLEGDNISFSTHHSLDDLRALLADLDDVDNMTMIETVNLADKFNGERYYTVSE